MSFSSDQLNYLVYRYLKESGFQHSAFTFGHESAVANADISHDIPFGSLITLIQKGLLYEEIEQQILKEDGNKKKEELVSSLPRRTPKSKASKKEKKDADSGTEEPTTQIKTDNVLILEGHTSEVFMCAWNPKMPLLASGSADCTAIIWSINPGPITKKETAHAKQAGVIIKHAPTPDKTKEVTTLDWNCQGTLLATGSYEGIARIWDLKGNLKFKLAQHTQPIFSLKWNKSGDLLLSGSVDKTTIVWDANTGAMKQQFDFHKEPVLDVDWKTNSIFASCSTDAQIFVCEVGKTVPLARFSGHTADVNSIRWSPQGTLLASGSDDKTAKIWKLEQTKPVHTFSEHKKEIYTLKWSPTGPQTRNPNKNLLLATASFDATVKLWDVEAGRCVSTLAKHTDSVYSVAFSPDGDYIASGSFDKCVHIWSVKDGTIVKSYKGNGGIFEVCWNPTADKVAACFADNTIAVMDFRM